MKTVKKLSLLLFVFSLMVVACKKKEDTTPTQATSPGTAKKAYEKRWNVSSAQRLSQANTGISIVAIEFTLGSYLIFYSNDSVATGTYSEINSQTLQLGNYGTLAITSLSDNSFNFVLTPTGAVAINVVSAPAPVLSTSANTTALCQTWKIAKQTITVSDTSVKLQQTALGDTVLYVTFSQYGTYLSKMTAGNNYVAFQTNSWKWTDSNENSFCYGEWDGTNLTSCAGQSNASISLSNNNANLSVVAIYSDTANGKPFHITETDDLVVQ